MCGSKAASANLQRGCWLEAPYEGRQRSLRLSRVFEVRRHSRASEFSQLRRMFRAIKSALRRHFPVSAMYGGSEGTVWLVGIERNASSIAAFFCGDDVSLGGGGRVSHRRIPKRITEIVGHGGLAILNLRAPGSHIDDILHRAIAVPALVDIHTDLPGDIDSLRAQLLTSTTREDFRRIRRANFSFRVTKDPDAIREFHSRHYAPLVAQQFPEDGRVRSVTRMLGDLELGGELVCADIDGEWVAGILNIAHEDRYALIGLGIRDADNSVRQKRVVAALIIRSLERAVELGQPRATLGRSVPFLGKGPVWFKAKWNGVVTRDPSAEDLYFFMDLRHQAVRRMLASSPVIHSEGNALVASTWLEPGEKPLQATVRDAGRFPGISRWYVLADPETLAAGAEQLAGNEQIVPVPVSPGADRQLWLGEVLSNSAGALSGGVHDSG